VFGRLFRRVPESESIADRLYGAIVAHARNPALYTGIGVADTVDGRFEMVVLHTILVVERLQQGDEGDRAVSQQIFDLFCVDMDRSLRELGVGDFGVPKRMKAMAERFYGRAGSYRGSLASGDEAGLADSLSRNVFGATKADPMPLTGYVLASYRSVMASPSAVLFEGRVPFADPAAFVPTGARL
jgi:cytochrome b pre-mRNA-processing protein 3